MARWLVARFPGGEMTGNRPGIKLEQALGA